MSTNHCIHVPPPPPLPPPMPSKPVSMVTSPVTDYQEVDSKEEIRQSLRKIMNMTPGASERVWYAYNTKVTSILQDGPKCGLVALCMAANIVNEDNNTDVDQIFNLAEQLGFTCQGEMFSATAMGILCNKAYQIDYTIEEEGLCSKLKVLNHLARGLPVLVPYDADFNHVPCNKQGHKAHWAVVTGFLLGADHPIPKQNHDCTQDEVLPTLFHLPTNESLPSDSDLTHCYLLAKQGKSIHLQIWRYEALESSNTQLLFLDPEREKEIQEYVVPAGGIKAGLCSQIILLQRTTENS